MRKLPDETLNVAVRWKNQDAIMGTFDLSIQRIILLVETGEYASAEMVSSVVFKSRFRFQSAHYVQLMFANLDVRRYGGGA